MKKIFLLILLCSVSINLNAQQKLKETNTYSYYTDASVKAKFTIRYDEKGVKVESIKTEYTYNSDEKNSLSQTKETTFNAEEKVRQETITNYYYYNGALSHKKATTTIFDKGIASSKNEQETTIDPATEKTKMIVSQDFKPILGVDKLTYKSTETFESKHIQKVSQYNYDASGILTKLEEFEYSFTADTDRRLIDTYTASDYISKGIKQILDRETIYTYTYDDDNNISQVRVSIAEVTGDIAGSRYYIFNNDRTVQELQYQGQGVRISKEEKDKEASFILTLAGLATSYAD